MKNNDLETLMSGQSIPVPDEAAKRMAINLAMAEFKARSVKKNKKTTQGFSVLTRLTVEFNKFLTNSGSVIMNALNKKLIVGGVATSCAVLLGFLVVFQLPETYIIEPENTALKRKENLGGAVVATNSQEEPLERAIVNNSNVIAEESAVVGIRKNLQNAMDTKRTSSHFADAISDDEMGRFPEVDFTESLQHSSVVAIEAKRNPQATSASIKRHTTESMITLPITEGRDKFETVAENTVKKVSKDPVSTFSIDVDTASYSFVRRQLNNGVLPQKAAVRVEEMMNYFDYDYPQPKSKQQPFKTTVAVIDSPWDTQEAAAGKKLVHIGIKGYDMKSHETPKTNLVFLLDVSGSMSGADKLPLVKQSMELLLSKLQPEDTVAIAVYAGAAGTVLEPTMVKEKQKIIAALNKLNAGGSTAGAEGIKLAYELAEASFNKNAINRVILATDGDFNVGISNRDELKDFVERKKSKGIYLSVLGFGQGNYNDHMMQSLAQNGNGIAAYIDTLSEAQKVLVNESTSSLFPIATDVKIQVEFNPETVSEYRLVGYETRHLNREDFNNDKVDAGDIGAGHTVTAIYEITPVNSELQLIDDSRYKEEKPLTDLKSGEYGFLKLRYKLPGENISKLLSKPIMIESKPLDAKIKREVNFAAAVAGFSQLLKGGRYTGSLTYQQVIDLAQNNKGEDEYGYRTEFIQLVRKASIANKL